ncbi:MAG: PQQ-dependent sugar dehydrogenase, partial [Bacteroidota bacterium]|nr:PQQ-dependent sugar dehydrogenase [Bacteroidota bacterium]
MKKHSSHPLFLIFLVFAFCSDAPRNNEAPDPAGYRTAVAFPQLSFTRPVDLQHPPDNSNRLFVVEQAGVISVFKNDPNASEKKTFLDIRSKVDDQGNEEGLLGLAFHPDYANNGFFYVNYTASGPNRTVVSRYKVSSNLDQADQASETVLLTFEQPYSNHNGGQV